VELHALVELRNRRVRTKEMMSAKGAPSHHAGVAAEDHAWLSHA